MIRGTTRLATQADVPAIQALCKEASMFIEGVDWSDIEPFWIVAEYKGEVVGCINMCLGKPFGYVPIMIVTKRYLHTGIGISLWKAAERWLASSGADGFYWVTHNKQVLRKLKRIGAVELETMTLCAKRIWRGKGAVTTHEHQEQVNG